MDNSTDKPKKELLIGSDNWARASIDIIINSVESMNLPTDDKIAPISDAEFRRVITGLSETIRKLINENKQR